MKRMVIHPWWKVLLTLGEIGRWEDMKRFTGLLDKNLKRIHEGDVIRAGMRRGDSAGWSTERVVAIRRGPFWRREIEWALADPKTGEKMDMQLDQELREQT